MTDTLMLGLLDEAGWVRTIINRRPIPVSALREDSVIDYPYWATRELLMNAICHRDYSSNGPVQFYQYDDRIEILNHGGLYGRVTVENFPNVNDYRNLVVAEAMKVLGFVNRQSRGVIRVKEDLGRNENGAPQYDFSYGTAVLVVEYKSAIPDRLIASAIEQGLIESESDIKAPVILENEEGSGQNVQKYSQMSKNREQNVQKYSQVSKNSGKNTQKPSFPTPESLQADYMGEHQLRIIWMKKDQCAPKFKITTTIVDRTITLTCRDTASMYADCICLFPLYFDFDSVAYGPYTIVAGGVEHHIDFQPDMEPYDYKYK